MGLHSGLFVPPTKAGGSSAPAAIRPLNAAGCVWFDDVGDASTVVAGGVVTSLRNLAAPGIPHPSFVPGNVGPTFVARGIGGMADMQWDGATTCLKGTTALLASTAFTIGAIAMIDENAGVLVGGGDFLGVTYSLEIASSGAIRCCAGNPAAGGAEAITRGKFFDGKPHILQATWDSADGVGAITIQVDGIVEPLATDTPSTQVLTSAGDSNAIGAAFHTGYSPAAPFQGLSPAHWLLNVKASSATLAGMLAWARARAGVT